MTVVRSRGMDRNRLEFTEFYTAARDECLRIVLVSVGDRQLAEDLVAEAPPPSIARPGLAQGAWPRY